MLHVYLANLLIVPVCVYVESLSDASSEIGEADDGEVWKSGRKAVQVVKDRSLPVVEVDQEDMDTEAAVVAASGGGDVSAESKGVPMQACSVCLQER